MNNVSIVIPAYIKKQYIFELTNKCLDGISKTNGINMCEVILVDDGSDIKYINFLKKMYSFVKFISHNQNLGFAQAVNTGIKNSKYELILLLNNDVQILENDWLVRFVNASQQYSYDISSPKQSMLDEKFNYIEDARRNKYSEDKCFCYPVGWCLLVKKQVFKEVGLLPLNFGIGFWEDTAWAYIIKNNYPQFKIGIIEGIDKAKLLHVEHQTFRAENIDISEQYSKNRKIFLEIIQNKKLPILPKI